mmetsp:Transcript_29700/g.70772  ORF Transcript_29700/g.70772 Transcript_29700/m.70772 type:complete len:363 (+) Transcript_29700:144-1232(+)
MAISNLPTSALLPEALLVLFKCAMEGRYMPVLAHPEFVHCCLDKVLIMTDHQHSPREERQALYEGIHRIDVEVIARLIQQQNVRFSPRDLCKGHAALLTPRQSEHGLHGELRRDPKRREVPAVARLGVAGELLLEVLQRGQRQVQAVDVVLAEGRHPGLGRPRDVPLRRLEVPGDELEQRRLADPVGPDDGQAAAHVEPKVKVLEQRPAAPRVPEADVVETHHRRLDRAGVWEVEDVLGVLLVQVDIGNALQRLDPALDQAGALGVVAELVDERLDVLLLPLDRLCLAPLVADVLPELLLKVVVGPAVGGELLRLEVDDVRADRVEELPRVRHDQHGLGPPRQVVLKPEDGVQVEVVGGLVQ